MKKFHAWLVAEGVQLPVILWVDGYGGHKGWRISNFCRQNGIVLLGKLFS